MLSGIFIHKCHILFQLLFLKFLILINFQYFLFITLYLSFGQRIQIFYFIMVGLLLNLRNRIFIFLNFFFKELQLVIHSCDIEHFIVAIGIKAPACFQYYLHQVNKPNFFFAKCSEYILLIFYFLLVLLQRSCWY
jgi:hypothetical protein